MMFALLAVPALAVEVCSSDVPCDPSCACSLAAALGSNDEKIYLRPGTHWVTSPVEIFRTIELTGAPGARLVALGANARLFFGTGSEDSRLFDVVLEGSPVGSLGLHVTADGLEAYNLTLRHYGSITPLLWVDGAVDVEFEDLVVRGQANQLDYACFAYTGYTNYPSQPYSSSGALVSPAVFLQNADVEIRGVTFEDNHLCYPHIVEVSGGLLLLEGARFSSLPTSIWGTAVTAYDTDLTVRELSVEAPLLYFPYASGHMLLQQYGGTLNASNLTAVVDHAGTLPAVWLDGVTSVRLTDITLPPQLHEIMIREADEVTLERLELSDGEQGGETALTLVDVARATIRESSFCETSTQGNGGAIALVSSCNRGCVVEDSVFVDTFAASDGGAILVDSGDLLLRRSTFRGQEVRGLGSALFAGPEAQVEVRQTLFADTVAGQAVLAGDQLTLEGVAADTELVKGGWTEGGAWLEGVAPVWLDEQPQPCGRPALLADALENEWLVQHRVGAFVPCWEDLDEDGSGGLYIPDAPRDCGAGGLVARGGDCDDRDPSRNADHGCGDADEDGVVFADDCDDRDPTVGRCHVRWSGGCSSVPIRAVWTATPAERGLPALWLSWVLAGFVALRNRLRAG